MKEIIQEHYDILGNSTVVALKKNRFDAEYFKTVQEAKTRLIDLIPKGATVGFGGSTTIKNMNIQETLMQNDCLIYDHSLVTDPIEKDQVSRNELTSDVFLTSTNAITRDGKLYNVDGKGNRVAAMIFGPKQVIVVAGINKVVADLTAAQVRVKQIAAPINNLRLNSPNPCIKTGYCMDCDSPRRICNAAVVLHKQPSSSNIKILLVGEELGF